MDEDVDRLRIALGRISRLVDRRTSSDGMTRTQLSLLATMARRKELGMSELADIEGLNPTMLSRIVGKLEALGYLRRVPSDEDKRAVVVSITSTGSRFQTRLHAQRTKLFVDRLAVLDPREAQALMAAVPALESLATSLRPVSEISR